MINRWFVSFFVKIDNVCYKVLSKLAILGNNGIHPKHEIIGYYHFFRSHIKPGDSVIDIGCGNGVNAYHVADVAGTVVGIDMNEKNIAQAQKKYTKKNIEYIFGDALTYRFNTTFDAIILSNVLEHIEKRIDFLKGLHHLSDTILIRVPMIDRDWLVLFKKQHGFEYRLDLTHYLEYTIDILKTELEEAGWTLQKYSVQFGECWGVAKKS
ncbi:MAG: Methyltransferase type 12 [Candidatus Magasanikbacteria bacterium GW2011_GWD2_43_18]|uniref:Methyltransferase type 12 n=1 Tax=Candidatus Magasanikbacteria bacterium GW2011_GWE2_42_7 TaxID=1619052 RepID=A0A0G1BHJ9_9BACT|nr:MAG: Methyltransferase type 12 [Candidatus Magasanikbacteria bacterium GW2011_GWC2_42_27]KKS72885.1 MAG: Methyltransferase type 12 [Candidatus Magasanikbacteria bacterium GW2011_GWE2_42_7]KKT05244.1 MAG: Methyltransferase type 12 [Candidatus Magasanikbacteria bacterium GW2011_GWD2_43_18]KKT26134.1 MAG: Methyltransferase type 12 [Candidatus Magasanikbacteria bacterium GW2011_GWA2_43_9]